MIETAAHLAMLFIAWAFWRSIRPRKAGPCLRCGAFGPACWCKGAE